MQRVFAVSIWRWLVVNTVGYLSFSLGLVGCFALLMAANGGLLNHRWRCELWTFASIGAFGTYFWLPVVIPNIWRLGLVTGFILAAFWLRRGVQWLEQAMSRMVRKSYLVLGEQSDMRELVRRAKRKFLSFDPNRFFKDGQLFLGRDEDGAPYWLPLNDLRHVLVQGSTGTGKGRFLQVSACQLIAQGESVFYLDPKDDEFAAHAMHDAALKVQRPYQYIQLTSDQPAQMNILDGATPDEIIRLLEATFQFQDRGKPSDFYLAGDREGVERLSNVASGATCVDLYNKAISDPWFSENAKNLLARLKAVASIPAINARATGISLEWLLDQKAAVYVRGDLDADAVRAAMRMLFIRVIQLASRRDRMAGRLPIINVIADEVRFQVSGPVLTALSTSRDKGVRLWLACQSAADVRAAEINMDKEAVAGIINENTPHKICYRIEDAETASSLAAKTGTIRVMQEVRETQLNLMFAETLGRRSLREAVANRVDSNVFLSLPSSWGIYMGGAEVKLLQIAPVKIEKRKEALMVTPALMGDHEGNAAKIDDIFDLSGGDHD